ncbi:MAG: isopenicillin N synthase family oxygenase [Bacteroidetes bacterium]|nr:isopenicillin N synthase family oxygenase [Bacteroidota bacterium]
MMRTIPLVDLEQFTKGNAAEKEAFVKKLGEAYEDIGFVAVENHGIPESLIDNFYKNVKDFFSMDTDTKKKYEIVELAGQRGYTSFGREKAKQSEVADLKEFWQIGQYVEGDDPVKDIYPENMEIEEIQEFNTVGKLLFKSFETAGSHLLSAIALYLGLDEDYFNKHIYNGNSILRAIHYPPITSEPASAIRAEEHEDINLITLLVGASADGLQLLNRNNEWKDISAGPGQIVVNVGDMLQRLTNNKMRSTTHRVVNPPKEKWHLERYSIPFFLHPRSEMRLDCLENCIDEQHPLIYDPISAGEYLTERLIEIGLLKK